VRFFVLWCLRCIGDMFGVGLLGPVPVFVVFQCGLFVFRRVHSWVAVGHDAGGREGHLDARWRLRHRAVFNGGLGLCVCVQLGLVFVLWAVEVCLSFLFDIIIL